ncbi:MAG: hypothetical protein JKY65_27150 [Planctomycetes bacterium]|nr:hypothetical protein [Planctomycetota bacterium]
MTSLAGLSLSTDGMRVRILAALAEQRPADLRAWIPQPGGPCAVEKGALPPSAAPSGTDLVVEGVPEPTLLAAYLGEIVAHWETSLAALARRLVMAEAVHGLSNALTPFLCEETADSLTPDEQARMTWRSDTLRNLARGADSPAPLCAGPFLRDVSRALEHAGVALELDCPSALAARPLATEHRSLRARLVEACLAAHQVCAEGDAAPLLRLGEAEGSLTLELSAGPRALFPRRAGDWVEVERSPTSVRLTETLPRPWLIWLGPAPADLAGVEALGLGLVLLEDPASLEELLAQPTPGLADRPAGIAMGGPRLDHAHWRREILAQDLQLGRACHSAVNWPQAPRPEVVDLAGWCRKAAGA